jgi:hypothetical protein
MYFIYYNFTDETNYIMAKCEKTETEQLASYTGRHTYKAQFSLNIRQATELLAWMQRRLHFQLCGQKYNNS